MPTKPFKVNIYDVELPQSESAESGLTSFGVAIDGACGQPLDERYSDVNEKGRRLEHCDEREGCHLLNFVTFEFAGPGRSAPKTPAAPIDLDRDESFAHETAMLYDPEANLAFVESTQGGMGPGAIVSYFERFANRGTYYRLIPRLDDDAAARARRHQTIRSLIMRVNIGQVTEADRASGIGVIKSLGETYDAGYINIEVKTSPEERRKSLRVPSIWETINTIIGSNDANNVTQLKVSGRENDDEPLEIIDLIQHREKRERLLNVDGTSRKIPHEERWNALIDIRREFLA